MPARDRIFGLDLLRAVAVLLVIFHHSLSYLSSAPAGLRNCGWLGEIGVGALLVLSGYLIGQGLIRKTRNGRFSRFGDLGDFYARRFSRTLPPYYFFLGMMAALFPPVLGQLVAHKEYFVFMQNFAWDTPLFYCQTWTLALLEFFYLLFPLLLMIAWKITRSRSISLAVPVVLLFLLPLALRALHGRIEGAETFGTMFRTWVIYRLDTPIIGVMAALVEVEMPWLWAGCLRRWWIGTATFSGLLLYYCAGCPGLYASHWLQVIFYPLSALALAPALPLLVNWKQCGNVLGRAFSSISQVSYTLYVSHFFAMILAFCFLGVVGISAWYLALPVLILFVAAVAVPSYYLTEEPFIRLRDGAAGSLRARLSRAAMNFCGRWKDISGVWPARTERLNRATGIVPQTATNE